MFSNDKITIRYFYYFDENPSNSIEYLKFKDGSLYDLINDKLIKLLYVYSFSCKKKC